MRICFALILPIFIFMLYVNYAVASYSKKVHHTPANLPNYETALLLGTAMYLPSGFENPYFTYRMNAASELYKAGKIKKIIASGDGHNPLENEPQQMRDDLVTRGIPADAIIMDTEGLRTIDSLRRCAEVFYTREFIIISQEFHCERALFLADALRLDAQAYAAKSVEYKPTKIRNALREFFARTLAYLEVCTQSH